MKRPIVSGLCIDGLLTEAGMKRVDCECDMILKVTVAEEVRFYQRCLYKRCWKLSWDCNTKVRILDVDWLEQSKQQRQ